MMFPLLALLELHVELLHEVLLLALLGAVLTDDARANVHALQPSVVALHEIE